MLALLRCALNTSAIFPVRWNFTQRSGHGVRWFYARLVWNGHRDEWHHDVANRMIRAVCHGLFLTGHEKRQVVVQSSNAFLVR